MTPDTILPGVPIVPTKIDQMNNEMDEEMDATELASVSNEDIYFIFIGALSQANVHLIARRLGM